MAALAPCTHCGHASEAVHVTPLSKVQLREKQTIKLLETITCVALTFFALYKDYKLFLLYGAIAAAYETGLYSVFNLDRTRREIPSHAHGTGCGNSFGKTLIGYRLWSWEAISLLPIYDGLSHLFHHERKLSFAGFTGTCLGIRAALTLRHLLGFKPA